MNILSGREGWPSILLARADRPETATDIDAAEAAGAWKAWRGVAGTHTPESVIRTVTASGLRGRGGAGFPTGVKWRECAAVDSDIHHVVANGMEADPGAQLDRTLMEVDPHAVLEGLAFAAYAVGASQAILAVNAGYRTAIERLRAAVRAAEERGHLGANAGGAGSPIWVEVREVSGSLVAGEETVLLRQLESRRAQPDQRPPYPTRTGLWDKPTLVNNVETLAAVPWIMERGGAAYAEIGTSGAPGTTLVQITGAVARPGIAEVPVGTTVHTLVDLAGGASGTFKAALVGGPTGGFLPEAGLDTPWGYQELADAGAVTGSGTVVVAGTSTCIVDLATVMTRYLNDEACGKTIPCRIGTRRLAELGNGMCTGRGRPTDRELVADLASDVRDSALCGLEAGAINPLLSGMRYFAEEFEEHLVRGSCPAGVCHPIRVAAAVSH
jgi:NADH:ubiquinone oxidoreductase subunit F (NADH-binding)